MIRFRTGQDWLVPFLARWSTVTLVLWVSEWALSATVRGGPLQLTAAPALMRWALLAQECVLLGLIAIIPALPARRRYRAPLMVMVASVVTTAWFAFGAIGRFPGLDAISFFMTVPAQAVQHVISFQASLLPETILAAIVVTALLEILTWLVQRGLPRPARWLLVGTAVMVFGLCIGFSASSAHDYADSVREIFDVSTGVTYRTTRLWQRLREEDAGPLSALLFSALSTRNELSSVPPADPSVPVERVRRPPGELVVEGTPRHRWNVLVVEVESMRADVLTAWGGRGPVMPTVEAIAREGRRYLDSYTTATQTDLAAAVPLSGQYPLREVTLRSYPVRVPYPKVLIYDLLAPERWRAAVFSSQNEEWWGMINFLRSRSLDTLMHAENFGGQTYVPVNDLGFSRFVRNARRAGKIDDAQTVGAALDWLAVRRAHPFFLYVNLQTSHLPYATPASAPRRFGRGPPSFPILFGRYPVDSAARVHDEYRNALAYADDQIARLRDALVADGRWDSTIVVVTGDHGQAFFEHPGVAGHANGLYQEQVQVPLVIRAPGLSPGDDRRPASHVDVAPTIADLLGFPAQPAWQGISLVGPAAAADRPRFFMVQSPLAHEVGVVAGQWKLVRNVREGGTVLTDLAHDPQELHDASAAYPDTAQRLRRLLDSWRAVQLAYYMSTVTPTREFPPRVGNR